MKLIVDRECDGSIVQFVVYLIKFYRQLIFFFHPKII